MEPVKLTLSFLGRAITLTDENCTLFRFYSQPQLDHLYFTEEREDGETQGYFVFEREDLCGMWERNHGHQDLRLAPTQAEIDAFAHWQAENIDEELERFDES